jgi:hypothetical protein
VVAHNSHTVIYIPVNTMSAAVFTDRCRTESRMAAAFSSMNNYEFGNY